MEKETSVATEPLLWNLKIIQELRKIFWNKNQYWKHTDKSEMGWSPLSKKKLAKGLPDFPVRNYF